MAFAPGRYVWKIKDLLLCPVGGHVESPVFITSYVKWKVLIFPLSASAMELRYRVEWEGQILATEQIPKIHARIDIYIDSGKKVELTLFSVSGEKLSDDLRFRKSYNVAPKSEQRDNFMVDHVITCRIEVGFCHDGDSLPHASQSDVGDIPSELESQTADLTTHLLKQATDVTLRSGDGLQEFPAHRLLLSARSEVFEKMLSSDMRESRTGVIHLPDITSPELEQLVNFLYGREVKPDFLNPRLYHAAHEYGLHALQRRCSQALVRGLSVGGVCQVAALAHLHSDAGLFSVAKTFFVDNASAVVVSDGYAQLLHESPDVLQALARVSKNEPTCRVREDNLTE